MADVDGSKPVSPKAKKSLSDAARSMAALLPKSQFTRPDEAVSHYISDADLVRLEHCEHRSLSPYVELAWGAVIGNLIPTIAALQKVWVTKPVEGERSLDMSDVATLALMFAFVVIGVVFTLVSRRDKDSIGSIVAEIKKRPRSEPA